MKLFVYCKELKEKVEVKNFGIKTKSKQFISLKNCTPYIPTHFSEHISNYKLHPTFLDLKEKITTRIKIGFFHKKEELIFSLIVEENPPILNPIIIKEKDFFKNTHFITIHCDGKRILKHSFYLKREKLDFYTLIDKIFFEFVQFDAILDKRLVISFRKEER